MHFMTLYESLGGQFLTFRCFSVTIRVTRTLYCSSSIDPSLLIYIESRLFLQWNNHKFRCYPLICRWKIEWLALKCWWSIIKSFKTNAHHFKRTTFLIEIPFKFILFRLMTNNYCNLNYPVKCTKWMVIDTKLLKTNTIGQVSFLIARYW